ncbi:MAG: hypothetical protein ABIM89_03685 [Mycobacteriales bacterium]
MTFRPLPTSTRARLVVVAAAGVIMVLLWRMLAPAAVSTPKTIDSLPRHDTGYWFQLAERVREGAADDPRLGTTAAAAYGRTARPTPTLGVLAAVIKVGRGPDIVSSVVNALSGSGVSLGPRVAAPEGKHGGTFECGSASFGADSGTYCVWWTKGALGMALVNGLDPVAARALALKARNATQR